MFRSTFLFALLAFPCLVMAAPPSGAGWHLVFEGEFSGEALDTDKWRHNAGPRRDAVNSPAAMSVGGGISPRTVCWSAAPVVRSPVGRGGRMELHLRRHGNRGGWQ